MAYSNRRAVLVSSASAIFLFLFLAGVWILRFERQARAPVALAAKTARGSAEMRQLLGEPLQVFRFTRGTLFSNRGNGNADLTIQIRGPLGRGALHEWAQEGAGKWRICSPLFQPADSSTKIPLVGDSSTHCERE
jgi:hypothetical protein